MLPDVTGTGILHNISSKTPSPACSASSEYKSPRRIIYKALRVKGKKVDLHRHILESHLNKKLSPKEVVHHINGNPLDNRIENLQVMPLSEHSKIHMTEYMKRVGRSHPIYQKQSLRGSAHSQAKLTENDIRGIRTLKGRATAKKVAKQYGVSPTCIYDIWKFRRWGWLK